MRPRNQLIIARLILEKDDQVLLLKRPKFKGGNYSLVGGLVEMTESVRQALIRETYEEIGVRIKKKDLEMVHVAHRRKDGFSVLHIFFRTSIWYGEIVNREPEKCTKLKWFPRDQMPRKIAPAAITALTVYRSGLSYSELEWDT
jgi:8-oxo-dGTP diphosphatase